MQKCRIEILKTTFDEELAAKYGCEELQKCHKHRVGEVFYADYAKPANFCDEAWKAIYQYVFALAHDGDIFYSGRWVNRKNLAICSCNDGIRPVIFKIEAVGEAPAK